MVSTSMSDRMKKYFENLEKKAEECYVIAERCRKMGLDPSPQVEIPRAKDLAERVEELVNYRNIRDEIRNLLKKEKREMVAILIAKKIASELKNDNREVALEKAVRVGLAVLTEGILVAPIEGISEVKIGKNADGSEYAQIFYAGPIRSAGGTAQALSVLIADVVRREIGIGRYIPTEKEVERYKEEIQLYNRKRRLQYMPSMEEIEIVVRRCPVCIDGEGTEDFEVSGNRDLPRVGTNRVRGGMCLVLAEGLILKAPKLLSYVEKLGIDEWEFVKEIANKRLKIDESDDSEGSSEKYLSRVVVGRPIFSHPNRPGGFRLRYGRCRAGGIASIALNPATMIICDEFIAVGTQVMTERPGKAGGVVPCDTIEGPIVLLDDGSVVQVNTYDEAVSIRDRVIEIIDLGEILIPFGEFLENNHPLCASSYTVEWWVQELERKNSEKYSKYINEIPTPQVAIEISKELSIPLHPYYNLFWHDVTPQEIIILRNHVLSTGRLEKTKLKIGKNAEIKEIIKKLGVTHRETEDSYVIDERYSLILLVCLGLKNVGDKIELEREYSGNITDPIEMVSMLAGIKIMPKAPTRIGLRMGRPEKADKRKMNPAVHVLFPVGEYGKNTRLINKAIEHEEIEVEMEMRVCIECKIETPYSLCDKCGNITVPSGKPKKIKINIKDYFEKVCKNLSISNISVKGVKALMSKSKTPEPLEKGVLRAKYDLWVFKDGTIRYDMSNLALTHFRPREIGLSVKKALELGYETDYLGNPLVSEDQICELKVQDIIIPRSAGEYLLRVAAFVDELLEKFYKTESYYNINDIKDLIGHLVIGLAPHTSGGILARIIGFTDACACFAHPFFHAAKRRNCDGDEDSIILLLDALLNFSRKFLPETRGGLMDAPLLLSTRIDPNEIDKEALNVDVMDRYPLEFYYATLAGKKPDELLKIMDIIKNRLGTPLQYENFRFTNDTSDIARAPLISNYRRLDEMYKKALAQLELAKKIRATNESDVAERIIASHLLPDIYGNLKKFGMQKFKCTRCNTSYRRITLDGKCENCNSELKLTVSKGSITKYVELIMKLANEYNVSQYLRCRIMNIQNSILSLFPENYKSCRTLKDYLWNQ